MSSRPQSVQAISIIARSLVDHGWPSSAGKLIERVAASMWRSTRPDSIGAESACSVAASSRSTSG
jgi:hypothetical protein